MDVLNNARCDDSRVLLLAGSGNTFCSGIDLHYLLTECSDRHVAAKTMSDSLRSVIFRVSICIISSSCFFKSSVTDRVQLLSNI